MGKGFRREAYAGLKVFMMPLECGEDSLNGAYGFPNDVQVFGDGARVLL